jgi:flavodoxin
VATMKALVAFYTRTGTTRLAAEAIARGLDGEVEEVVDTKDRSGATGYFIAGKDAWRKNLTTLQPITQDPAGYPIVVIGTPVWAFTMAPAVRTYLTENKEKLSKVAFFCTMGGSGDKGAFAAMEELSGRKPIAVLALKEKDIKAGQCADAVKAFVEAIRAGA